MGSRKGEKTGGDRQLTEGTEEGGKGREGRRRAEESGRRMEAEISQGRQKALPATRNASQKSSGTKIRKLGTKFKFGQLFLRKIIKIVATRCHIVRLKCTKFDFGWSSAPDPAGGAHTAIPRRSSWI